MMSNLAKFGYILIGIGIGILGTTIVYEKELDKEIDVEDYIIEDDPDDDTNKSESEDDIQNGEKETDEHFGNHREYIQANEINRASYESNLKKSSNKGVRYSKIYSEITDDLGYTDSAPDHTEDDYLEATLSEDEPDDDDEFLHDPDLDLPRERVESYIEIFADENPSDFVSLVYYMGDESLTDDREQLIPNPEEVVGRVALDRLVKNGPGVIDGVIYVRNVKTHINYEVVLDAGSYSETVLGIFNSRRNGERRVSRNE